MGLAVSFIMVRNNNERRIKNDWAIKVVKKYKKLTYKELLIKLMRDFNMSRRYTKEVLDVALCEVKDGRRKI